MLFKVSIIATLVVAQLLLFAINVHEVLAVSSILLGYCTDNRKKCENKYEVYGDPSWDQGLPGSATNLFTNKTEAVTCNSFQSVSEYALKLCACSLCAGCEDSQCAGGSTSHCTGSSRTGTLHSVCAVRIIASDCRPARC